MNKSSTDEDIVGCVYESSDIEKCNEKCNEKFKEKFNEKSKMKIVNSNEQKIEQNGIDALKKTFEMNEDIIGNNESEEIGNIRKNILSKWKTNIRTNKSKANKEKKYENQKYYDKEDLERSYISFFENFETANISKKKRKTQNLEKNQKGVVTEKVWYDSDNENSLSDEEKVNEETDRSHFHFTNDKNSEDEKASILIENENNPMNIFEKYIENFDIEYFQDEQENEDKETERGSELEEAVNTITEDVFIYNDELIRNDIAKRKERSGKCQNNLYLPYSAYKFNSTKIDKKVAKQLLTIPKENLIMPVYGDSIYVLQFKDSQLDVLKKIKFKVHINYAEEHNGNIYLLAGDDFVRIFNQEKSTVYKNRLNVKRDSNLRAKSIRFCTDQLTDEMANSNMFSVSFFNSGRINLYDYRTLDSTASFLMNNNYVGMNFHGKSNTLFTIDKRGYIYKWCLRTNKLIYKLMDNYTVFPSCLNIYKDYLVTCSCNGFLNLFHIDTPSEPVKSFKNITHYVQDAIFCPSHDYLLYYSKFSINGVKLIDLKANYVYCNFPLQHKRSKTLFCSANFFNNGDNICLVDRRNTFYIYDLQKGF